MSQIPVNNTYNVPTGTPLYNYQTPAAQTVTTQQGQSVSVTPGNTSQIYNYPATSLYEPSKQAASGVNIYIYNPSGIGGPSSNSTANATYALPGSTPQAASPVINNNIPAQPAPVANTSISNTETTNAPEKQKTKKVVELTDDYIKTLESYLRSPEAELRKTGIKELIKRYEEDKTRYNDPALTALLNIALQDSDPNNRMFAMSPIASGSAQGDENTVQLLQKLQTSDKLYGQEAKMANDALLNAVQNKIDIPDDSPEKNDKKEE